MPTVSIIMASYNRRHTLQRAITSVIEQTFHDWELIIVDDGSTDDTQELLSTLVDPRIRIIHNDLNRGVASARNAGFDAMKGEWFTLLDSDDEMIPSALATLLAIPKQISPQINAITCNCIDSISGKFTGFGLEFDQFLDFETLVSQSSGEHWGITKSSLLGDLRFNQALPWGEFVLWYRISRNACRYYLHMGLRIYHTEGHDRISNSGKIYSYNNKIDYYRELAKETEYLELLKQFRKRDYASILFRIALVHILEARMDEALQIIFKGNQIWTRSQRFAIRIALAVRLPATKILLPIFAKYK